VTYRFRIDLDRVADAITAAHEAIISTARQSDRVVATPRRFRGLAELAAAERRAD